MEETYGAINIGEKVILYEAFQRGEKIILEFTGTDGEEIKHYIGDNERIKEYLEKVRDTKRTGRELADKLKKSI